MRVAFARIDGVRTRYLYEGSGPPLVLLHAVGHSGDTFVRNIDALAARHTVVAPDMLGHGFTDAPLFDGTPPQPALVRHLGALADYLGFERYSVAGSSFGGLIAALMWYERPARVDNLVLIGSGAVFHPPEEQAETLAGVLANATRAMAEPTLASCRSRLAAICFDPASVAEEILPLQLTSYALDGRFDTFKAIMSAYIASLGTDEHRVFQRLETLRARTLIVTGRDDIRAKWQWHVKGRDRIPGARLVIFESCGHLPYLEHPTAFNGRVLDFLAGEDVGEARPAG